MATTLEIRLNKFRGMKYRWNESFQLVSDFIVGPLLPELIDVTNKVHEVTLPKSDSSQVDCLKLYAERDKKPGFWNGIIRLFCPMQVMIKIRHGGGNILLCEYYKHSYYTTADKIRMEYEEKLAGIVGWNLVVVCRAK